MTTPDVYILAGSEPLQAYPSQVHASVSGSASGTTISSGSVTGIASTTQQPLFGGGSLAREHHSGHVHGRTVSRGVVIGHKNQFGRTDGHTQHTPGVVIGRKGVRGPILAAATVSDDHVVTGLPGRSPRLRREEELLLELV